jgi:hypothetical protein
MLLRINAFFQTPNSQLCKGGVETRPYFFFSTKYSAASSPRK